MSLKFWAISVKYFFLSSMLVESRRGSMPRELSKIEVASPAQAGGKLPRDEDILHKSESLASVLRGDVGVHDAGLPGLAQHGKGRVVERIIMPGHGQDFPQRELSALFWISTCCRVR